MSEILKTSSTKNSYISSSSLIPEGESSKKSSNLKKKGSRALKFVKNVLGLKQKAKKSETKTSISDISESEDLTKVKITYSREPSIQSDQYDFPSAIENNYKIKPEKEILQTRNQWRNYITKHTKLDHVPKIGQIDYSTYRLPQKSRLKGDVLYQKAAYLRTATPTNSSCSESTQIPKSSHNEYTVNSYEEDKDSLSLESFGKDDDDDDVMVVVKEVIEEIITNIEEIDKKALKVHFGKVCIKRFGTELISHVVK